MLTVIFEPKVKQVIELSPEQMKSSWEMARQCKDSGGQDPVGLWL